MKNQALLSLKDESRKLKCLLLQFLFGALRVNVQQQYWASDSNHFHHTKNIAADNILYSFFTPL